MRRVGLVLLLVVLQSALSPISASAQQPGIHYVHDNLDRLIAVIDQQGNAATYTYDAVGNILRIDRFDAPPEPGRVIITFVAPGRGRAGAAVEVFGKGFAASPAGNTLAFNGAPAAVAAATANRLVTAVPPGATTGPITVTTALGTATSPAVFQVVTTAALTVTPSRASVSVTRSLQLQALEGGTPTTNVRWSVNGVPGGDPTIGTVSATGLYTAPPTVPAPPAVTVAAMHRDDATVIASASLTVLPPQPAFLASSEVSVAMATPLPLVDRNVVASVSVRVAETAATFVASAPASVTVTPVVTAVSPAAGSAGMPGLVLTLSGAGFTDASGVTFLRNNAPDPSIGVSSLTVSPTGTQAEVEIAITPGAPLGARVVQITTPAGPSSAAGTGGNLFTVE